MAARRMLKTGRYSLTEISDISGLSLYEIESLEESQPAEKPLVNIPVLC